jgi:hypothetical protein
LSYSKVRALTRIEAMSDHAEEELVEFAKVATAAQVDRTVAAYRGVVRNTRGETVDGDDLAPARLLRNDDGTVTLIAPMPAELAVEVVAALDAAQQQLRHEHAPAGASRREALRLLARTFLDPDRHAPPSTTVVIHTDAELWVGVDETGTVMLDTDAVRRLSCDAMLRHVRDADTGATTEFDLGRARRSPNRALRRALVRRDGDQCRWPGCTSRHWLHAHHLQHWTADGPTDLANLAILCSFHHRLAHEGRWRIDGDANGPLRFTGRDGTVLREDERRRRLRAHWLHVPFRQRHIHGDAIRTAHGERLDLDLTITALCCLVPPDRN